MKRDEIFRDPNRQRNDFVFDAGVAEAFDDMLDRSVPHYREQQQMICSLGQSLWRKETVLYDLGCSNGNTLVGLGQELPAARLVGYDNSVPMLQQAQGNLAAHGLSDRIELRHADLNGELSNMPLENAGMVTLCWTLQFVRPLRRDNLIRWIYEALADEGALIVTEKILTGNGHMNRFFIDLYYDFKRQRGYSDLEIARKREALENVLVPYRLDENVDLFRRNGFQIVEPFFQWFNFAGFLCIKNAATG
jgi:tRNA (cmo5U34)-methyltransferase